MSKIIPMPEGTVLVRDNDPDTARPVLALMDDSDLCLVTDLGGPTTWRKPRGDEYLDHLTRLPAPPGAVVPSLWFEDGALILDWEPVQYLVVLASDGVVWSVMPTGDGMPWFSRIRFLTPEQAADPAFVDYAVLNALEIGAPAGATHEEGEAAKALVLRSIKERSASRPYLTAADLGAEQRAGAE